MKKRLNYIQIWKNSCLANNVNYILESKYSLHKPFVQILKGSKVNAGPITVMTMIDPSGIFFAINGALIAILMRKVKHLMKELSAVEPDITSFAER